MSKIKKGIIGFFDIMGYQSFLENNDVSESMSEILEAINKTPQKAQEFLHEELHKLLKKEVSDLITSSQHLVFSDSILLVYQYPSKPKYNELAWLLFLAQTTILQRSLFEYGLPLKGAIAFGEFIMDGYCFAGKPIIEAYKKGLTLEAAAIVLADSAVEETKSIRASDKVLFKDFPELAVQYLMPIKGNNDEELWAINFLSTDRIQEEFVPFTGDIRKRVVECFRKHNKDIPRSACPKITNTESFIRFMNQYNQQIRQSASNS